MKIENEIKTETIIDILSKIEEKTPLIFSVEVINLSPRFLHTLLRNGISTISDLVRCWESIPNFINMGAKGVQEISDNLEYWYQQEGNLSLSNTSDPRSNIKEKELEDTVKILLQIEKKNSLPFSVEVLNLSPRVLRALLRNKVTTIGHLVRYWRIIPNFTNMGVKGIQQIADKLEHWYQQEEKSLLSGVSVSNQEFDVRSSDTQINEQLLERNEDFFNIPIEKLALHRPTYNMLKRKGINKVGQIYAEWQNLGYGDSPTLEIIQKALIPFQNTDINQKVPGDETLQITSLQGLANDPPQSLQYGRVLPKISIERLDITERAYSLLKKNNIHTIDQLTPTKLQELRSAKIIGSLIIGQIRSAILLFWRQEPIWENAYSEHKNDKKIIIPVKEIKFNDYFDTLFGSLKPRYLSIIEFRYGLRNNAKSTLEETAKQFGVTRERIRQIEGLALEIIKKQLSQLGKPSLFAKIKENVDSRGGLISESRLIDELQHVFMDTAYSIKGIVDFVNKMSDGEINLDQDDVKITYLLTLSAWSTSSYDKEQVLLAANKIIEILSAAELPMQWSDLFSMLIVEDGLLTLDEHLAHAVALCLNDTRQTQRKMDGSWSIFERNTRSNRIIYAMRQIGYPAHFSEISDMYDQVYSDQPLTEHGIHTVLSSHDEFVRVGQGKYGLPEWGIHNDGNVSNAVRRILIDHKHPMTLADITDEVLKTWDVQNSAVISAIDGDARFSKTEDGKIWLTETGLTLKKRIKRDDDTRWDRLLIVLRELGKPFPVYLIVETHNNSYPERPLTVSAVKGMMYRKPELFVRTGRDEFGLAEWGLQPLQDVPVNRSEEILKILRRKSPIHIKELHNLYNEYHPEKQVSLITIGIDLRNLIRNLAGTVSSPRRGIYQIIDEVEVETTPSQQDKRIEKILKIFIDMNRPSRVRPILERYNQLHPADAMTLEGFMEYLMYAKNHPEKYPALFEDQQLAS